MISAAMWFRVSVAMWFLISAGMGFLISAGMWFLICAIRVVKQCFPPLIIGLRKHRFKEMPMQTRS